MHGLVHDTRPNELTYFALAKLHALVADAIEAEGTVATIADEFATHLERADELVVGPCLAAAALTAGDAALDAFAAEETKRWRRIALETKSAAEQDQ